MSHLNIFVASLYGMKKHKAYASYDGEHLVVTHMVQISGPFGSWKKPLINEVIEKRDSGWVVIVEEKTDHISQYASKFNLEEMDIVSGRSNIYLALDYYFPMLDMGHIIVGKEHQQFLIRSSGEGQKIERGQDEKGRPVYSVDWARFSGGHRAMLLCVIAAMVEPVSDRYVSEMLDNWLKFEEPNDMLRSYRAITSGQVIARIKEIEARRKQ